MNIGTVQLWEFCLLPIVLFLVIWFAKRTQSQKINYYPEYKYYIYGLLAKISGGIIYVLVYVYYYKGGDTTMYYDCAKALCNLLIERPNDFLKVFFSVASPENKSLFTNSTGSMYAYMYYNIETFTTIRFVTPFVLISCKGYLLSTVFISWITFSGIWKVYSLFCRYFPSLIKQFAIAFLFIPSVVFWGSGLGKDSIIIGSVGWLIYSFHHIFILKRWNLVYIISFLIATYFIFHIKTYTLYALFPGLLLWTFHEKISGIKNYTLRVFIITFVFLFSLSASYPIFYLYGKQILASEALNEKLTRAAIIQYDLKQDYYGGNSFDIGSFDPTPQGIIEKLPIAVLSGVFRPFFWEGNEISLLPALESTCIFVLLIIVLYKIGLFGFIRYLFKEPILLFLMSYSFFFAFMVGLTTANFGALVRFKIPFLPFFLAGIFIFVGKNNEISYTKESIPKV